MLLISVAMISVMLVMAACDTGGTATQPGQAAVSQPQQAQPPQTSANAVATAYRPGGQPTPAPAEVIPPAPALPAPSGKVLYQDNFSSATSINSYTIVDLGNGPDSPLSSWLVQDNALLQNGDVNGNPASNETLALTGPATWQNYSVEVEAYGGATPLGPVARYSKDGFYRLRVNRSNVNGAGWLLQRYDASKGDYTTLAKGTSGSGFTIGQWNYLKLTVQGSTISANINGQNVATVTDATYATGNAGLYTEATFARFSNLRVTALQ